MRLRKTEFAIDRAPENSGGYMAAYFPVNDHLVPEDRLNAYAAAKVDVIELGIKTADPYADGAVIAASMRRSDGQGNILEAASLIDKIRAFDHDTLGMIFAYADNRLSSDPSEWSNVDGLLCLGKNRQLSSHLNLSARAQGTRITKFIAYDMAPEAIESSLLATGFVMLQYTNGKTGIRESVDPHLNTRLASLRSAGVQRPVLAGVGISTPDQARHAMDSGADGVVLGSMSVIKGQESTAALEDYLCEIRGVLNGE